MNPLLPQKLARHHSKSEFDEGLPCGTKAKKPGSLERKPGND